MISSKVFLTYKRKRKLSHGTGYLNSCSKFPIGELSTVHGNLVESGETCLQESQNVDAWLKTFCVAIAVPKHVIFNALIRLLSLDLAGNGHALLASNSKILGRIKSQTNPNLCRYSDISFFLSFTDLIHSPVLVPLLSLYQGPTSLQQFASMKNMHGDDDEQNHGENEGKHEEEDDGRRDVYEETNPSNYYENMMNWEDEVIGAEDLLHVDDTLMSYGDFPPLPDFPCISSSSSSSKSSCSSSAPPPTSSVNQRQHRGSVTCRNNSFSSSPATSSASSSASWAVGKSDHKESSVVDEKTRKQEYHDNRYGNLLSTTDSMEIQQDELNRLDSGDCMGVMEGFGEMGLFDTDDIWDPSCLFPYEEEESKEDQKCSVDRENDDNDNDGEQEKSNNKPSEDLALVFLEWLKSNKETISAEDLRSIKLKRSTIECAAKRLGGGKEGMKQLLKLILEWVQNNHLQKKRLKEGQASISSFPSYGSQQQHQNLNPNSHEFSSFTPPESNPACFVPTANQWNLSPHPPPPVVPQSTYVPDPMATGHAVYPPPPPQPMHGFVNGDPSMFVPSSADYMFDASSSHHQTWSHHQQPPPHHFSLSSHPYGASYHHQDPHAHHLKPPPPLSRSFSTYHQNQYQPCHQMFQGSNTTITTTSTTSSDGSLIRLGSSATKEARKKRMARQRKIFSHHQRHAQNNHQTNTTELQQTRVLNDTTATHHQALNNPANWVYWSPSPQPQPQPPTTVCGSMSPMMMVSDGPPLPADPLPQPTQSPNYHKQINMETRRDGCKPTEKNLKFLLQKVLEQSDVGNLGRIVLPKKEAETYLPELEARDGISIAMEDIGTSRVWNMRYRFWPNNKSRMYLLENTGDFVRSNGLQEGDFIVIYSDIKCGKFMIRGVKVRQPGAKSEAKKSAKAHRNLHANSPMGDEGPSTSMIKQAVA